MLAFTMQFDATKECRPHGLPVRGDIGVRNGSPCFAHALLHINNTNYVQARLQPIDDQYILQTCLEATSFSRSDGPPCRLPPMATRTKTRAPHRTPTRSSPGVICHSPKYFSAIWMPSSYIFWKFSRYCSPRFVLREKNSITCAIGVRRSSASMRVV